MSSEEEDFEITVLGDESSPNQAYSVQIDDLFQQLYSLQAEKIPEVQK